MEKSDDKNRSDDRDELVKKTVDSVDSNELFDLVLKETGGFGRYQIGLLLLGLFSCLAAACNHLSPIYLAYVPKYHCIQGSGNPNTPLVPTSQTTLSEQCQFQGTACTKWKYETDVFNSTIVTSWNLVCDRAQLMPTMASSYMAGIVITIITMGIFSDKFGRRTVIITLSTVHILASFITAFAQNYLMFVCVRFFVGGSIHAVWSSYFVLMAEIVPASGRSICGGVMNFGWQFGSWTMTLIAYLTRDWFHSQLAFAILSLTLLSYFFIVPESPRWMLNHGQTDRAEELLRGFARKNGVNLLTTNFQPYFSALVDKLKDEAKESRRMTTTVKEIATNREYLKRLALLIPPWFAVGTSSYGIHFFAGAIDFDIFATTAIKEALILVVIVILMPILKKVKKTWCLLTVYVMGGLIAASFIFIPEENNAARVAIYLLAQGVVVGCFFLVDTYTPDVFSTDVRNFTFSFLDSISKIGTTISPYIVYLGTSSGIAGLPPAIFGGLMLVSSLCFLFTPETKEVALAQHVKDLKHSGHLSIFQWTKLKLSSTESAV